jgi:hypothetical protein
VIEETEVVVFVKKVIDGTRITMFFLFSETDGYLQ